MDNTGEETIPDAGQTTTEDTKEVSIPEAGRFIPSDTTAGIIAVQILSNLEQTPDGAVANIQFGTDPNLDITAVQTLFDNSSNVAKCCTFTHKGVKYTLIIPPIDTRSDLYKKLLKILAKEPHGCAGPLRLAQIFAELGVTVI